MYNRRLHLSSKWIIEFHLEMVKIRSINSVNLELLSRRKYITYTELNFENVLDTYAIA